ncbi:MAG: hypothetical protein AB1668_04430 [Nanoarchaeota archaeon]
MEYLKRGLKDTFNSIRKHKTLFISLIILEAFFIVLSLYITAHYQLSILEDAKKIIEPFGSMNFDARSITADNFNEILSSEDVYSVYTSYKSMLKNVEKLAGSLLFLFIFMNGGLWILSSWLLEKHLNWKQNLKKLWKPWCKITTASLVLIAPFLVLMYYLIIFVLRIQGNSSTDYVSLLIKSLPYISLILYYFLIAAFALAKEDSWRLYLKSLLKVSIFKIHKCLLVLLINATFIAAGLSLIYLSAGYLSSSFISLLLLLSAGLFFLMILAATRIFWIACLSGLAEEK